MIWGAIGGTIPDLDIIANSFLSPVDALAFHRGISHSITFSIMAPLLFGWLVHQLYQKEIFKRKGYKIFVAVLNVILLGGLLWGVNYIFRVDGQVRWLLLVLTTSLGIYLLWRLYKYYLSRDLHVPGTTFKEWYWLFFLAFFTHMVLDCFTAYGTQIFMPFSNYRVAFNNISIVDPAYTVPFLLFLILAATQKRGSTIRSVFIWLAIGISSMYMLITIYNKIRMDKSFDQALSYKAIHVDRCRCSPTILNNVLWSCVAESENNYYLGQYSLLDADPKHNYLNEISKSDSIHQVLSVYKDYQTLLWFSDDYLAGFDADSVLILSDLRFGSMTDTITGPSDLIFNFKARKVDGTFQFEESRGRPSGDIGDQFTKFVKRIKGL